MAPLRLLLTNDDGIDAPGLRALEGVARSLGEVTIVAPAREWSGCGHRVTTHESIAVEERGPREFAVHGTPADCVRLALHTLAPEFDLALAGINRGGNLGVDVHYSGTVAAAREAALHGRRGIAISHYLARRREIDWGQAARLVEHALKDVIELTRERPLWNVNLPHLEAGAPLPRIVIAPVDPSPLPLDFERSGDGHSYRGNYHARARRPDHDVAVCFGGEIAISALAW